MQEYVVNRPDEGAMDRILEKNCNYSGPPVPEALPTGPRLTGESQ